MADDQKNPPDLPVGVCPHKEAQFPPLPKPTPVSPTTPKVESLEATTTNQSAEPAKAQVYSEIEDPLIKWQVLVDAFQLNRRSLLSAPGVTAVDIGYKIVDGAFTDELAIRIHVKRKLPNSAKLTYFKDRPFEFFPTADDKKDKKAYFQLRGGYDVPIDVIEGNYGPVQLAELPRPGMVQEIPKDPGAVNARRRLDPLVGGISIGSPETPAGTLGALVWDKTDGSVCILSNWHVLSGDPSAEAGVPCFQPGRLDQGRSSDVVAHLKRWSFDHQTDAAIAELNGSRRYCAGEILSLVQQITGDTPPYLGMVVKKYGRSTGPTWGFVDGLYFSSTIEYNDGIVQVFENQIHIAPTNKGDQISDAGDSGSVWVTRTESDGYKAVGLHFAGDLPKSAFGEYALANPMSVVMQNLSFSFRPGFLEIRDEDVVSPPPMTIETQQRGDRRTPSARHLARRLSGASGEPDPIVIKPTG